MTRQAGIPLIDLFWLADRASAALPQYIEDFYNRFVVTHHSVRHSATSVFHHGRLQPLDTAISEIPTGFSIGIGQLSIPVVQTGIPFQLGFVRAAVAGNLEPNATTWRLDLSLDAFSLLVDGLRPAIFVPDDGTVPRHLLRDPSREHVRITGSAVLRIEQTTPAAGITVSLVDQPDPLDPAAAINGSVATVTCTPPHFFIGGSEFGLSVGRLQFDFAPGYSPPDVLVRGQDANWIGVAIREATFYAPRNLPGLGDLSGGVKNVLIGSPVGLQGELEVQFGRTPFGPTAFQFEQVSSGADLVLTPVGGDFAYTVTIQAAHDAEVTVRAGFTTAGPPQDGTVSDGALQEWKARWTWPDGTVDEGDSSTGAIRHGQVLRVTPIEIISIDGTPSEFPQPEITFRFKAAGTAPGIDAAIGAGRFVNVTHVGGTEADLATVTLTAVSTTGGESTFEWRIDGLDEGLDDRTDGPHFTIDGSGFAGEFTIVLRETVTTAESGTDDRFARVRVQVREEGALLVGCEAGVFDGADGSSPLTLAAVEDTFDLSDFHAQGVFNARLQQATLGTGGTSVIVPPDGLARVTVGDPPVVTARDRQVQLLMDFDTDDELRWGAMRPAGQPASGAFSQSDLLAWANRYASAQFVVVGRCDDIGDAGYNATLAADRAVRGKALLTTLQPGQRGEVIAPASVFARGEQFAFAGADAPGDSVEEGSGDPDDDIEVSDAEKSEAVGNPSLGNGWLITAEHQEHDAWPANRDATHASEPIRESYRRVDIYAVGGTPSAETALETDEPTLGAALRRSLVPAGGRDLVAVPAGSPKIDYAVKLRIVWDSPTVSALKDAIPTLAEAEFTWTPEQMPLPELEGGAALSRDTFTVFATWTHDARTGYTKVSLGIKSDPNDPNGLIASENKTLTAALALAPALLYNSVGNDLNGSGIRIFALITASAFATTDMGDGSFVADGSRVTLTSAAFETEMRAISDPGPDMQVRVVTDYVCTLHLNTGVLGLRTLPNDPMKVRYKRVGLEYDTSKTGWERYSLVYDSTSLEIEDPGRWSIDGYLGNLLRIVEITIGAGSVWVEARLAVAIEIGLIEVTEAIIRLTFNQGELLPVFELRGLVVKASIPNVLEGEGRMRIENDGIIRAGVDASLIPLGVDVQAALAIGMPEEIAPAVFLSLYVGVQFATPLPLANSGLALYGLKGLFTMNGARNLPDVTDPVERELAWWGRAPLEKYAPVRNQFALGVGAVVGTLPDVSFCLSCAGMIVVAFPQPEVIFGVDVNIVKVPDLTSSDQRDSGSGSGTESSITGLIVIDDEAVTLGVSATYSVPKLFTLDVPFAAYFPYPETPGDVYVRIGSDGQTQEGRPGEPVTLTLLPDLIDARAWAYLMVEQGGLQRLGGDARFSFDGFAVGFGAGWAIHWRAAPIALDASAKVLVGFGTAPLMIKGGVFVAGTLDMVVVSISARGELILEAREFENGGQQDMAIKLEGEFCGEVDLFFFSLEGCVDVAIDLSPEMIPPAPPSPVRGISLTDRCDRVMGVATRGTPVAAAVFNPAEPEAAAAVDGNNTVWPDTAPVIHFTHYVENAIPAISQFDPGPTPTQPRWFGSSELKYAYRLEGIALRQGTEPVGAEVGLQSVWTASPYRQPDASGVDNPVPSEHEGPNLKLLDWDPWSWVVNMTSGGSGQDGDPVETIGNLCDPKPSPAPACVLGLDARRAGLHRVRMRQDPPGPPPYPSRFFVTGEPSVTLGETTLTGRALQTLAERLGGQLLPGSVVNLPFPTTMGDRQIARGYCLPSARRAFADGLIDVPLPWDGTFDQPVATPSVTLLVCDAPAQRPEPAQCDDFRGLRLGQELTALQRPGLRMEVIDHTSHMTVVDEVDERPETPRPGADGMSDVRLPEDGVEITLREPCARVEVHLMLFSGVAVTGRASDARGNVIAQAASSTAQDVPHVLTFASKTGEPIAAITLTGGNSEAVIYRICCADGGDTGDAVSCVDFEGLRIVREPIEALDHRGLRVRSIGGKPDLLVVDEVDAARDPDRPGADRKPEVRFSQAGMRVRLPAPCEAVELKVMLFTAAPVTAQALNGAGARVARARTPDAERVPHTIRLAGKDIEVVELAGGGGEAVVYEICMQRAATDTHTPVPGGGLPRFDDLPGSNASERDDVAVTGVVGRRRYAWSGEVVEERVNRDGLRCRLVVFHAPPAQAGPWSSFRVEPVFGTVVTLVSVCGIDQRAIDARDSDGLVQDHLRGALEHAIETASDQRRDIVLTPDGQFEIVVTWSWQAWQPDEPGETPPEPSSSGWSPPIQDIWRFATAPAAPAGDSPQDGLNEYVFDARDLDRYLIAIEPADGRAVHFTDDPLWIHFECGHVEQLLAQYARSLVLEVRRTDPPPQSTTEDLVTVISPLDVTKAWLDPAESLLAAGDQRLNDAVLSSPCLPDGAPFGGASVAATAKLEPDAHYDFTVLADGGRRDVIRATRFHTSRYANPRAFVDALGYTNGVTAPYLPDDVLLPEGASLPAGPFVESDLALDAALAAIDADTLPLPSRRSRTYALWSVAAGAGWRLEGLLVDSLEPMKRERTIVASSGQPSAGTRIALTHATADGTRLDLAVVNARWTRAILKPAAPIALTPGKDLALSLHFDTSDGPLSGVRRLRAVPSILEREGL